MAGRDQSVKGSLYCIHRICVVSGRMELLPSFLPAGLSAAAAAAISFSSPVLRCCFRALLHFVRTAARPSRCQGLSLHSNRVSKWVSEQSV